MLRALVVLILFCGSFAQEAEPVDLLVESANGNYHIVEELLRVNTLNPNVKDSALYTPLIYATKARKASTVDALLQAGADPDDVEGDGWSPLHFATFTRYVDIIALLAKAGANPYLENKQQVSPMSLASERGDTAIVEVLQDNLPMYEKRRAALHEQAELGRRLVEAAKTGNENEMKALIDMGVDVHGKNENGWTALTFAAGVGSLHNVRLLIEAGCNVNDQEKDGWTPLMFAAYQGHAHVVDEILRAGGSATTRSSTGVTAVGASKLNPSNHPMFVKKIADHALFEAMKLGDGELAVEAIDHGGDVHTVNTVGWSPIILLTSFEYADAIQRLIGYSPPHMLQNVINWQENDGWTAMMFASLHGFHKIVNILLDAGADPNVANFQGNTAISLAAARGHDAIVQTLLEKGAKNTLGASEDEKGDAATRAREDYARKAGERAKAEEAAREVAQAEAARAEAEAKEGAGMLGFIKSFF